MTQQEVDSTSTNRKVLWTIFQIQSQLATISSNVGSSWKVDWVLLNTSKPQAASKEKSQHNMVFYRKIHPPINRLEAETGHVSQSYNPLRPICHCISHPLPYRVHIDYLNMSYKLMKTYVLNMWQTMDYHRWRCLPIHYSGVGSSLCIHFCSFIILWRVKSLGWNLFRTHYTCQAQKAINNKDRPLETHSPTNWDKNMLIKTVTLGFLFKKYKNIKSKKRFNFCSLLKYKMTLNGEKSKENGKTILVWTFWTTLWFDLEKNGQG